MFSASTVSKLMAACVMAVMVMAALTVEETEALPRGHPSRRSGPKTTREPPVTAGATDTEMVLLQLDHNMLVPPTRPVRPVANHSISPWTVNVTYDGDLFPPMISEARCSLKGCLDADGAEDRGLESKPILHQMLVLRRVDGNPGRNYHYRLESRLVAVGCTCVRPSVTHQH